MRNSQPQSGPFQLDGANPFARDAIVFPLAVSRFSVGAVPGVPTQVLGGTSVISGTKGQALLTTGAATDFIKLGAIPSMTTTAFTALVIVRIDDLSGNATIFESGSGLTGAGSSNGSFQFRVMPNGSLNAVRDNIADLGSSPAGVLVQGKFAVVAVSYGSGVIRFAANGAGLSQSASNETFLSGNFSLLTKEGTTSSEKKPGAVALFAYWPRLMSLSEMATITDNPWQVLKAPQRRLWATAAAPAAVTADLAWTEGDETTALAGVVTNRASIAWTEAGDTMTVASVVTDRATLGWTEQSETMAIAGSVQQPPASSIIANVSWTEAGDTFSAQLRLTDRASVAYSEQNETWLLAVTSALPPGSPYPQMNLYTIMRDSQINLSAQMGASVNLTGILI